MKKLTKNKKKIISYYKKNKIYNIKESLKILKKYYYTKFNPSINLYINLKKNIFFKKIFYLPYSNGKKYNILVLVNKNLRKEIINLGIKLVGGLKLIKKIEEENFLDFDLIITNKYYMNFLLKLGKKLGKKNLIPSYEEDNILDNPIKIIKKIIENKRILIKPDKYGVIHLLISKLNNKTKYIIKNILFIINKLKNININNNNIYIKSIYINTTMSPSLKLSLNMI